MDALRGGLHEHKENVEAAISGGNLTYSELPTKAQTHSGKLHPYSTPKSVKVSDKSSSTTKKPRRALGDISNQHRTPNKKPGVELSSKRQSELKRKVNPNLPTPSSSKKAKTAVLNIATPPRALSEEIEEIEYAYGGLPSNGPDPAYLERIRQEIVSDLLDTKTQTIMDVYTVEAPSARWEPEIKMLSTASTPSAWWSSELSDESFYAETAVWSDDSIASTMDHDTPRPDDCNELPPDTTDDGLLDEILNVSIPMSTK